ncbi:MAG: enoyl-CoA hydratase/isomerase family protein [Brachymonas sp.]
MNEENFVIVEERGNAGLITLNRPKALNALNLPMIRTITAALLKWRDQSHIKLVAIRGTGKHEGGYAPFGAFCAGGDIRFFHQAALAGDPTLEDFFTEEYSLNHLIHTYPKPYIAFMDGICMGGGMGISGHGGANSIRIVTERSKLAMPETMIGLFPDVGGGWFLSRTMNATPGMGEYLALTGELMTAPDAIAVGLADVHLEASSLPSLWEQMPFRQGSYRNALSQIALNSIALGEDSMPAILQNRSKIEAYFGTGELKDIITRLQADNSDWAQQTLAALRKRSPLMLHVTLELIRRARSMSLADDLRLERDLVRHCFHTRHVQRSGSATETVEGIRALAVDKDHAPNWNPPNWDDVSHEMVQGFFASPWPASVHPLRSL